MASYRDILRFIAVLVVILALATQVGYTATAKPEKDKVTPNPLGVGAGKSDVPTTKAGEAAMNAGIDLYSKGEYAKALPLLVSGSKTYNALADMVKLCVAHREAYPRAADRKMSVDGNTVYLTQYKMDALADSTAAMRAAVDLMENRDTCIYYMAMCHRKMGDDAAALPLLLDVARSDGSLFQRAWSEIEAITGISVPSPQITRDP